MEHPVHLDVSGVAGRPSNNGMGERILQTGAADVTDPIWFDVADARQCILNGVVAGAPTEIALETEWEVFLLLLGKARGCHDHARGAEPALERLRIEECLLHWVKLTVGGQPFDGFNLASFRTKCWDEAAVDRFTVKPDRACTAVACIAALFYAEPSQITHESAQALAGSRLGVESLSVDFVAHGDFLSRELLADFFREVVGEMLAMRRRPMRIVEVKLERDSLVDSLFHLARARDAFEAELHRPERGSSDRQKESLVFRTARPDQQHFRATEMRQSKTSKCKGLLQRTRWQMNGAQQLSGRENIGMIAGDKFNHRHVVRLSTSRPKGANAFKRCSE